MNLIRAINKCHVRSAVYRKSNPNVLYWKNSSISIEDQVTNIYDRMAEDWEEFDPQEHEENYNPA